MTQYVNHVGPPHLDSSISEPVYQVALRPEVTELRKILYERLQDGGLRLIQVARDPVHEAEDAVHVRVVQDALGGGISCQYLGDQLSVVHRPPAHLGVRASASNF